MKQIKDGRLIGANELDEQWVRCRNVPLQG